MSGRSKYAPAPAASIAINYVCDLCALGFPSSICVLFFISSEREVLTLQIFYSLLSSKPRTLSMVCFSGSPTLALHVHVQYSFNPLSLSIDKGVAQLCLCRRLPSIPWHLILCRPVFLFQLSKRGEWRLKPFETSAAFCDSDQYSLQPLSIPWPRASTSSTRTKWKSNNVIEDRGA